MEKMRKSRGTLKIAEGKMRIRSEAWLNFWTANLERWRTQLIWGGAAQTSGHQSNKSIYPGPGLLEKIINSWKAKWQKLTSVIYVMRNVFFAVEFLSFNSYLIKSVLYCIRNAVDGEIVKHIGSQKCTHFPLFLCVAYYSRYHRVALVNMIRFKISTEYGFDISEDVAGGGEGARSLYCGDCSSFTITSTGPAAQLHSNSFGTWVDTDVDIVDIVDTGDSRVIAGQCR